jgi:hypothetical protein
MFAMGSGPTQGACQTLNLGSIKYLFHLRVQSTSVRARPVNLSAVAALREILKMLFGKGLKLINDIFFGYGLEHHIAVGTS